MNLFHYTTVLFACISCGFLASEVPSCDRKVVINEDAPIDTAVCKVLNVDSSLVVNITGASNKDDRFGIKKIDGDWTVVVKHLLDYHNVGHSYSLEIKSASSEVAKVQIEVVDVSGWPPKFNYDCSNTIRKTEPPWAFDALGKVDAPFLGGDYIMSRDTSSDGHSVSFNIDNDQCQVKAYGRIKYENNTIIDIDKLVQQFIPDRDVDCRPTSKEDKNQRPKITVYKNPKTDRPSDPYIFADWFTDDNPNIRYVLIELDFSHVYTEMISSWTCQVETHIIGKANATLDLVPTGCTDGKYGGNCKKDCVCQNGATCHPFNGACDCAPGFRAPDCTISFEEVSISPRRPVVYFGDNIELTCKKYHVAEDMDFEWNFNEAPVKISQRVRVTKSREGTTLSIKKARDEEIGLYTCVGKKKRSGYVFTKEVKLTFAGCHDNLWGAECNTTCGCTHDAVCDRYSGCLCDAYHWWGKTCDRQCYCERNGTCDKQEGFCQCLAGTWGRLCQRECDCAEGTQECHTSDGECICKLGWSGDKCDFDLKRPAFIVGVTISGIVVLVIGAIFGVRCYRRRKYEKFRDSKNILFHKDGEDSDDEENSALYDRRL